MTNTNTLTKGYCSECGAFLRRRRGRPNLAVVNPDGTTHRHSNPWKLLLPNPATTEQGLDPIIARLADEGITHEAATTGGNVMVVQVGGDTGQYLGITAYEGVDPTDGVWWMSTTDAATGDYLDVCTDDGFTTDEVVTVIRAVEPLLSTMSGDDIRRVALAACAGLLKARRAAYVRKANARKAADS